MLKSMVVVGGFGIMAWGGCATTLDDTEPDVGQDEEAALERFSGVDISGDVIEKIQRPFPLTHCDESIVCPNGAPRNCSGHYDPYAGFATVTALPGDYPFNETFESYADNSTIECQPDISPGNLQTHLDVTNGCLFASTSSTGVKRGYAHHDAFRAVGRRLAVEYNPDRLVKYSNTAVQVDFRIGSFYVAAPSQLMKLNLFARYTSPDDLYVATIRQDGDVTIKSKKEGCYETLYTYGDRVPDLQLNTLYRVRFEVRNQTNQQFRLYVNDSLVAEDSLGAPPAGEYDWRHTAGTHGIRTDQMLVSFDNWQISDPPP